VARPRDLAALREKYETMLALRALHERARTEPGFAEPNPRPAMVVLAGRFPGALRELDELPLGTIRARLADLAEAEREPSRIAPWMTAQAAFHRLTRGALAAKKWLGRRREVTDAMRAEFVGSATGDAIAWADDLASLARPPRGRILDVVFLRAARELGLEAGAVRALVFGSEGAHGAACGG
jgi:hypothetical protein